MRHHPPPQTWRAWLSLKQEHRQDLINGQPNIIVILVSE
jgi:hypothetical protein